MGPTLLRVCVNFAGVCPSHAAFFGQRTVGPHQQSLNHSLVRSTDTRPFNGRTECERVDESVLWANTATLWQTSVQCGVFPSAVSHARSWIATSSIAISPTVLDRNLRPTEPSPSSLFPLAIQTPCAPINGGASQKLVLRKLHYWLGFTESDRILAALDGLAKLLKAKTERR
ncbi:hypothetical protein OUZ56_022804 [Daphnia magna]|uniref:Uncharacterized protein n=1 Tax=Daphnia magna TaxID=35525 RepID=A0ABR0AXI0_9CRUS|nr:hypothetical protein OUZ56_022804 [Daphnia magna]